MAFALAGTLARKHEQRGVDEVCVRMKTCPHTTSAVGRGGPDSVLYEYVCPDCGSVRRAYLRERGRWVRVGGDDA